MRRQSGRILRCALPPLAAVLALLLMAFALPAQYNETFLGGFVDKLEALRQAQGSRIILAGGSGTAFAVRSDLLEEELPGYRVINLGMYAGLGSTVPLDAAAPALRAGDVVVFLPEQSEQTLSLYFGGEAMWQAADGHWQLLTAVRPGRWPAMLAQLPYFAARKAGLLLRGTPAAGDGIYASASFNSRGDIDSSLRDGNVMPGGFDANMPIRFDTLPQADFLSYLNSYARLCRDRGARFFFGFCPMNAAAADPAGADDYLAALAARLDCPILGAPRDSLMAAGWFYDTNFHLNSAGAVAFTARLAAQLKRELGVAGEVAIAVPEMPGAAAAAPAEGQEEADADCFVYRETASGWQITALTEAGAQRGELTVPAFYRGMPVIGFEAAVFAGRDRIERITLQPGLKTILDGSFAGCSRLRALVLRGIAPSACAVGQGLLSGTETLIYVDAERLAAYQTSYFWSPYADRIRPAEAAGTTAATATSRPDVLSNDRIHYDANGGRWLEDEASEAAVSETHLRTNTLQGTDCLTRPGWLLAGWNTRPDGSGEDYALGSRASLGGGDVLYARWLRETPAEDFVWRTENGEAWITGCACREPVCVIPAEVGGLPVAGVCEGAFRGVQAELVAVPPCVRVLEPGAFADCPMRSLILFDTLETVSDSTFAGCSALERLRINAATVPVYSISYYAAFADKLDWLRALSGQKKLVLFSGSSTRYGYDSGMLHRHFPAWQVANMGVYAYTNALPQLQIIRRCMEAGDTLLHAPEFDCLNFQTCESSALDFHFWAMAEADYGCLSLLNLTEFSHVFDSLQTYLTIRKDLPAHTYEDSPNGYDDDGNNMRAPTYNQYGDFIMPRASNKVDVMLKYVRAEYTPAPFTPERLNALNRVYRRFQEMGVQVLFTYTPRNRSSITENSTPENHSALDALLREKLCVPVISSLEDSLMSGIYFFVIDSHLSTEGVRLHTLQLVEDLKPWLAEQPAV